MDYKHSCVVDGDGYYKTYVLVLLKPSEAGPELEEIQNYTPKDRETLIDAPCPAGNYIRPCWDGTEWAEGAAAEETAAQEAERPVPETPSVEARLSATEAAILAMMGG